MLEIDFAESVKNLTPDEVTTLKEEILKSSSRLFPQEHSGNCPVHHGASVDCCWPISVCVEDDFVPSVIVDLIMHGIEKPYL